MFAVNGCWKRNSFSTSLVAATVAAVAAAPVAVASMDIHDCLYVCIGDDGGGGRYALVLWIRLTGSCLFRKCLSMTSLLEQILSQLTQNMMTNFRR
jgi:hypothetical protein